jgi:organic hydroperoxide reductase OsmC/OhrA
LVCIGEAGILKLGQNIIASSGLAPFFKAANPEETGIQPPPPRRTESVRTAVRTLSGFQKEALVASSRTGAIWRLVSDEGPYLNGHDAAPCPLAFFTCGMVASYLNEIFRAAERKGVLLRKLRLTQNNYYTMKGSMLKRTMIGGAEPVDLLVEVDCDLDDAAVESLVAEAIANAPVTGLLSGIRSSLFKLSRNGETLPPSRVAQLDAALLENPDACFEKAAVAASSENLVQPVGMTPKKEVPLGTSSGGSSLADEQNRRLNVAAIAERRDDGITQIRQLLYSPHGTSFQFLSSEDGRAPDASSLISAGIAFCFMTQFGRFVSMLKLDLPQYSIVQDTHFAHGNLGEAGGTAGDTDAVETHVYLQTSESPHTAAEMLDIAEQTCFLHALCRTVIGTRIEIGRC